MHLRDTDNGQHAKIVDKGRCSRELIQTMSDEVGLWQTMSDYGRLVRTSADEDRGTAGEGRVRGTAGMAGQSSSRDGGSEQQQRWRVRAAAGMAGQRRSRDGGSEQQQGWGGSGRFSPQGPRRLRRWRPAGSGPESGEKGRREGMRGWEERGDERWTGVGRGGKVGGEGGEGGC